jgi:acetyl-CoA carboxylase biotin carboxyl carrier protein
MTADGPDANGAPALGDLANEVAALVGRLPAGLRRVRVRSGPLEIEVDWPEAAGGAPVAPPQATVVEAGQPAAAPSDLIAVTAPVVGTLYRSPAPGKPPFVEVGDLVEAGSPMAVIEAMKLMNHIDAPCRGRVVAIHVSDAEPVEFGQVIAELAPESEPDAAGASTAVRRTDGTQGADRQPG